MTSFFGDVLQMFGGGDAKADIQTPQVGVTTEEADTVTGVQPQSDAEKENIRQAELDEEQRRKNRKGQQSTILAGSLAGAEDETATATQKKTLLGA